MRWPLISVLLFMLLPVSGMTNPISANIIYDLSHIVSGGSTQKSESNNTDSRMLATFAFQTSSSKFNTFYVDSTFFRGDNGSQHSDDLQGYSNIDADKHSQVHQIWFNQQWQEIPLAFKIGWIDANTDFANVENAADFIHSSMGFSPSITYMPTYPDPRLGGQLAWQFDPQQQISLGIFADESEHFNAQFSIAQYQYQSKRAHQINIKLGTWYQSGKQTDLSNPVKHTQGAFGWYSIIQGQLPVTNILNNQATWYIQVATSDEKTSPIKQHLGLGLVFPHKFNHQNNKLGIGITHIKTSQYSQEQLKSNETAVEAFYQYKLNDHFSLKPNIQYIYHPAEKINAKNMLVATLRAELNF